MSGRCRLYLITPERLDAAAFARDLAAALGGGDVACLQLRLKGADDDDVRRAGRVLMPVCHDHDVALIINDRPDLAVELGADGVHIGQQDTDLKTALRLMGADRIVGVTCHASRHLAMVAAEAGADYVAFGAFHPSTTKATRARAGVEILEWWNEIFEIPCVAIGGITVANCAPIARAGADFIAVSSAVWEYAKGPAAAVTDFNAEIAPRPAK